MSPHIRNLSTVLEKSHVEQALNVLGHAFAVIFKQRWKIDPLGSAPNEAITLLELKDRYDLGRTIWYEVE
jgi:hypothetical protein